MAHQRRQPATCRAMPSRPLAPTLPAPCPAPLLPLPPKVHSTEHAARLAGLAQLRSLRLQVRACPAACPCAAAQQRKLRRKGRPLARRPGAAPPATSPRHAPRRLSRAAGAAVRLPWAPACACLTARLLAPACLQPAGSAAPRHGRPAAHCLLLLPRSAAVAGWSASRPLLPDRARRRLARMPQLQGADQARAALARRPGAAAAPAAGAGAGAGAGRRHQRGVPAGPGARPSPAVPPGQPEALRGRARAVKAALPG
jgi:hypothetical protein